MPTPITRCPVALPQSAHFAQKSNKAQLPPTLLLNQPRHLRLPVGPRVRQWRDAVPVHDVRVSTGVEHQFRGLLMPLAAVAEDHDFKQAGPAEVVDVVDVDLGGEQQSIVSTWARSQAGISALPP
jgi:hypothetical protein